MLGDLLTARRSWRGYAPRMAMLAGLRSSPESADAVALVEAYVGPLFDYLPVALVMTDAAGSIVRMNPRAEQLLGAGGVLGRSIAAVLPFLDLASQADVWLGTLPGQHDRPLRVRSGRVAAPPVGGLIYALEEASPAFGHRAFAARARSRFAPSRSARL